MHKSPLSSMGYHRAKSLVVKLDAQGVEQKPSIDISDCVWHLEGPGIGILEGKEAAGTVERWNGTGCSSTTKVPRSLLFSSKLGFLP